MLDKLGSPETYNHYPTGWAVAFSTPYRMFKRYVYQGGVCDPLVVSWPKGVKAKGEVRNQYHHSVDIYPTILEACGIEMPKVVNGAEQSPLSGVSMAYSFEADGATRKETQYYEMMGHRGIWHGGWKAVTEHGPISGLGNFENDRWQLFHTDEDRAESQDVSDQHPDKVEQLKALWLCGVLYRPPAPESRQYTYYLGPSSVPEQLAAGTHNVSFKILAEVEFTGESEGVIVAQGSRFGGYSLFVKDGTLIYAYNFLGIPPEQQISAPAPKSGRHIVGVEFTKERVGDNYEPIGTAKLHIDDDVVAEEEIRTIAAFYALCGEGLCIGYDAGDAVSSEYKPKFVWKGGEVVKVVYDVADDAYVDVEQRLAAAVARD
jgi:arylsulfatase